MASIADSNDFTQHRNKAVASGAVSFFIEHFVSVRVARLTYGTSCTVDYDPADPEHRIRQESMFVRASGVAALYDGFSSLVLKVFNSHENGIQDSAALSRVLAFEKARRSPRSSVRKQRVPVC